MEKVGEVFPSKKESDPVVYDLDLDAKTEGEMMHIGDELIEKLLDDMEKSGALKSDREAIREAINMLPNNYKEALIREVNAKKKNIPED